MLSSERLIRAARIATSRGFVTLNASGKRQYLCTSWKATPNSSGSRNLLCTKGKQITRNLTNKPSNNPIKKENVGIESSSIHSSSNGTFLQRWLAHKEIPPRGTLKWYGEMVLICTVFAITGTSTMVIVRPAVSNVLGLEGSLKDGPWSYRICSLVIMTPLYSAMLVVVGVSGMMVLRPNHFVLSFEFRFSSMLSLITIYISHFMNCFFVRLSLEGTPIFDILRSRCFHVLEYLQN
jgi:hypothetical protein